MVFAWLLKFCRSWPCCLTFKTITLLFGFVSVSWAWINPGFEAGNLTGWTVTYGLDSPLAQVVIPGAAPDTNGTICVAPAICLNQVHNGNYAAQLYSGLGDT